MYTSKSRWWAVKYILHHHQAAHQDIVQASTSADFAAVTGCCTVRLSSKQGHVHDMIESCTTVNSPELLLDPKHVLCGHLMQTQTFDGPPGSS